MVCDTGNDKDPRTYLAGVSTKRRDVSLHPLKRGPLVAQAEVEGSTFHSFGSLREAERSNAVVEGHVQDRGSLSLGETSLRELGTCECGVRCVLEPRIVQQEEFRHRWKKRQL